MSNLQKGSTKNQINICPKRVLDDIERACPFRLHVDRFFGKDGACVRGKVAVGFGSAERRCQRARRESGGGVMIIVGRIMLLKGIVVASYAAKFGSRGLFSLRDRRIGRRCSGGGTKESRRGHVWSKMPEGLVICTASKDEERTDSG